MNKETFCNMPFDTIFLGADSTIKTCCSARNTIGDLNRNSIKEILQSDAAKEVRQHILDGKWHPQCSQCRQQEQVGARSERQTALEHKKFEEYQKIELDSSYFKPSLLDLRWSNTCNLACNYCYEFFSSKWANIKNIRIHTIKDENEESLFEFITEHKDSVTALNLLGGEPFLQKQNERLTSILHDKQYYILTNLAVPLEGNKLADSIFKIEKLDLGISFETLGDQYEYVRHHAKWDVFTRNLDYVRKLRPDVIVNAHPVYCLYSAFNLVDYYDFVLSHPIKFNGIYWATLTNIPGLMVDKMPLKMMSEAIDQISRVEVKYGKDIIGFSDLARIRDNLYQTIRSYNNPTVKPFFNFLDYTERVLPKKKSYAELWPEVHSYMSTIKETSDDLPSESD